MTELPSFAQQWVQQWKQAGPLLQAIRDEELRRLGNKSGKIIEGVRIYEKYPHEHGMVIMQRWFMRKQLLDQIRSNDQGDSVV